MDIGKAWDESGCIVNEVATLRCIPVVFQNIISTALIFAGAVAVLFIILGGYKMINSGGDPKEVDGARKTLTYAIAGLVLILLSFAIINMVALITGADCIKTFSFEGCN